MAILQSTKKTLTKSMPLMFDNKNSAWPDPEQSIGKECLSISGLRCWLPIGPALAAFEVLSKDLKDLLDKHKDALKQGEPKPRAISFNMWMTGSKPGSSSPTIVFSSKSSRQRAFAKALLKDSKLLDQYPGIKIKTWDRMPAIYQAGSQGPDTLKITRDVTDNVSNDGSEEAIYMVDNSQGSCGALIGFGRLRLATMGGILLINGTYYGISAQHGRYETLEEPEVGINEGNSLCFDDDSDTEYYNSDNLVEITSSESISSYPDEGSSTLSFTSTTSPKDRIFECPMDFPSMTELKLDHTPEVASLSRPTYSSYPKISNFLPYEKNDLDYEVFEINDPRYHDLNKIYPPSSGRPMRHIIPNKIARTLVECPVWAATGTTGCVQGTMMRQTHYIKMEGSETFQEMWAVKLDRNTEPGDSGAWVVDSTGQLFGHIVAGDPLLGLAFMIPAYKVFEDIKSRFGGEPWLCPSSSVIQSYNAPNDGKNPEQPLRDVFLRGKGTGTVMQRRGIPRVDKTVTAEVIAAYAHCAPHSIDYDDLGEGMTKTEKRAGQYLQSVVQEAPQGMAASRRDNLLGTSKFMSGTSKKLMAATFDASAEPPSSGWMAPNPYIGCNQETTFDAAADGVEEVYNPAMDQPLAMIVGSSSNLHTWNYADDDFASSTDRIPSSWHPSVTYRVHRPAFDDANYSALSVAWPSVPPDSFPTTSRLLYHDPQLECPDDAVPNVSARLRKSNIYAPRTNPLVLGLHDQIDEASLKFPRRSVRCAQRFGTIQETQWLAHQSRHFPSTPLAHQSTHFLSRPSIPFGIQGQEALDLVDELSRIVRRIGNSYDHRDIVFEPSVLMYDLLDLLSTLPRDKERISEQHGRRYLGLGFCGHSSSVFPIYDARPLRRWRRLNAPRRREDNSQSSISRQREQQEDSDHHGIDGCSDWEKDFLLYHARIYRHPDCQYNRLSSDPGSSRITTKY